MRDWQLKNLRNIYRPGNSGYGMGEIMYWQIEELSRISEIRPELVHSALDKMLAENTQLKRMLVVNAYLDGKMNISKAAEELNLPRTELEKQLRAEGIPIRGLSLEDIQVEVEAARE